MIAGVQKLQGKIRIGETVDLRKALLRIRLHLEAVLWKRKSQSPGGGRLCETHAFLSSALLILKLLLATHPRSVGSQGDTVTGLEIRTGRVIEDGEGN